MATKKLYRPEPLCCVYHPLAQLLDDHHTGDMICPECGLVVCERAIDPSCEWRTFSNEPTKVNPSRIGGMQDTLAQDSNLSTVVGSGTEYDYKCTFKMDATARSLMTGFDEIITMSERINATQSTIHRAKLIFKQVHQGDSLKYRAIGAKAAACLYVACRQDGVPRSFKEICAVTAVSKKEIGRCFKIIIKTLTSSMEMITSEDFMSRFCSNLGLSGEDQKVAIHIAQQASTLAIVEGRSPISVAAAAIYMVSQASNSKKTYEEIGSIAGVSELTIRQCYKLMYPHARELFPPDFANVVPIDQLPSE
ncbi:transcription initiation factor IIB-like [Anopheles ziemanni]|uniref:transcription initiation factor IIB-like n=1 Tax=Anopheles coustani TaxID=139045 RepID=UPI00265AC854|nr:transcription initiation factor IIB-like [Anopheles coustani]XP_058177320.1 transcription initiation factor IIB-like [Anopheles ziemanni]